MSVLPSFSRTLVATVAALSLLLPGVPAVRANDIVPSSDLTGGASAFIFRGSSKRPQARGASVGGAKVSEASLGASRAKMQGHIAATRKRRADRSKSRAAELARIRARERAARARQSNILTARAETQLESGEIEPAISNFREALKLNAANAEAKSGLSEALTAKAIETSSTDQAASITMLEEAVALNAQNDAALIKLGEIHYANANYSSALKAFEKALAIDPATTSIYLPAGLAYADQGLDEKALEYLTKAEAVGDSTVESRLAKGLILGRQGKSEEAVAVFERAIASDSANGAAYVEKARLLDRTGRSDEAFATLKKAVEAAPTYGPAWFELGVSHYNRGEYLPAAAAYNKAIELDPGNAQAHANLASTYRQMERFQEANAQYLAANQKGITKDADLYSEWGYCLGKTNEWDKATARLRSAEEISPTAIDHNNVGWAYYNGALVDRQNNNEEEANKKLSAARTSFQRSVDMDAELQAALLNLGATNNALGDFEAAVNALNRAVSLQGDWVIALNQLGLAHRGRNDLAAAVSTFNRAVNLDSNNVFGLFSLGSAQHASGDKNGAKKTQDRLKRLNPQLANQLGGIIAGKAIEAGKQKIKEKIRIPGIPF